MAATPINLGSISRATAQISEVNGNATDGNTVANDGRTLVFYRNANVTQRTITVRTTKTVGPDVLTVQDPSVTVLASSDWVPLGFFDPDTYGTTLLLTPSHSDVRFKAWAFA